MAGTSNRYRASNASCFHNASCFRRELLREVDAPLIDTANVSIASALEHLCELERALIALWQYADAKKP